MFSTTFFYLKRLIHILFPAYAAFRCGTFSGEVFKYSIQKFSAHTNAGICNHCLINCIILGIRLNFCYGKIHTASGRCILQGITQHIKKMNTWKLLGENSSGYLKPEGMILTQPSPISSTISRSSPFSAVPIFWICSCWLNWLTSNSILIIIIILHFLLSIKITRKYFPM